MTDTNKCNSLEHIWFHSSHMAYGGLRICFKCGVKQIEKTKWSDYTSEETN